MPELPEVETVRKQLEKEILGARISKIEVRDAHCYVGLAFGETEKIVAVERVGKYLFIKFESGKGMQVHLKMTGRLIIGQSENSENRKHQHIGKPELKYETAIHTRVVLDLADGRKIYYWDTRMFGYIQYTENIETQKLAISQKLGPEPWDISDTELLRKLQKTGRAVKEAILDQGVMAGVGNIYANDGLWLAGINPKRRANSLELSEVKRLRAGLCSVLRRGLSTGGASDNTYRDFYGERGGYQNEFLTYGRTGHPCNRCGLALKRIVVGGRGTWMCEKCQK